MISYCQITLSKLREKLLVDVNCDSFRSLSVFFFTFVSIVDLQFMLISAVQLSQCFPKEIKLSVFSSSVQFSSVLSLSRIRLFATPCTAARQASLSITNSWSSLRLTSIESVMPSSHLILCRPLLLLPQSLPASESFPMSQLFACGGQSTGVSALASFLP